MKEIYATRRDKNKYLKMQSRDEIEVNLEEVVDSQQKVRAHLWAKAFKC